MNLIISYSALYFNFYFIGNFDEIPYEIKSPPGRIALRRKGNLSLKRPAAGGESCKAGFFLISKLRIQNILHNILIAQVNHM